LVGDRETFLELIRLNIEKTGFNVDALQCPKDADAAFSTVSNDVIMLTVGLPKADGLDLLKS